MRTNIDIDDALIAEAQALTGIKTKKEMVAEALRVVVRLQKQREVDKAFGSFEWTGDLAALREGRFPE